MNTIGANFGGFNRFSNIGNSRAGGNPLKDQAPDKNPRIIDAKGVKSLNKGDYLYSAKNKETGEISIYKV